MEEEDTPTESFDKIEIIKRVVRNNKFDNFTKIIFPENVNQRFQYLNSSLSIFYLVLQELFYKNIDNKEEKEKYERLSDINIKAERILFIVNSKTSYGKNRKMKSLQELYLKNKIEIDEFLNYIYNLGKIDRSYNLDEYAGLQ